VHSSGKNAAFNLASRAPVPVVLAHGGVDEFKRLVVVARREDLVAPGRLDLEVASEVMACLGHGHSVLYIGVPRAELALKVPPKLRVERVESSSPVGWLKENQASSDLLVLCGLDAAAEALDSLPGFTDMRFLVAIGAHARVADAKKRETEAPLGGAVVGRSLTQAGA
jgi:hypothetical protein